MNDKPTFLYGFGTRSDYNFLTPYFNIPKINWNLGTIKPAVGEVDTLIGFSMGCMLAVMHAEKHKVKNLILCSPSPGEETLTRIKAENLILLVGDSEHWVRTDLLRLMRTAPCPVQVITIPKTGHKLTLKYLEKLIAISKCV